MYISLQVLAASDADADEEKVASEISRSGSQVTFLCKRRGIFIRKEGEHKYVHKYVRGGEGFSYMFV